MIQVCSSWHQKHLLDAAPADMTGKANWSDMHAPLQRDLVDQDSMKLEVLPAQHELELETNCIHDCRKAAG